LYWKAQEGKGTKATPMLAPMKNPRAQDSQKQFVGTQTMRQEIVCGDTNHGARNSLWGQKPRGTPVERLSNGIILQLDKKNHLRRSGSL